MSGCGHEKIIIQLQKKTKQQDEVIKQLKRMNQALRCILPSQRTCSIPLFSMSQSM